jgi:hypothetical protein
MLALLFSTIKYTPHARMRTRTAMCSPNIPTYKERLYARDGWQNDLNLIVQAIEILCFLLYPLCVC